MSDKASVVNKDHRTGQEKRYHEKGKIESIIVKLLHSKEACQKLYVVRFELYTYQIQQFF